ncbi:zinc finger protein 518A [Archocentrus centrarchus]|uniref:zinc finger protein 518A n=1 Tax=Archocentrus centrarchus TaxID=63155 RepID=UPI0011EA5064|nr:zinc finger protein 518A-like [Archocentrus centrarchus]
MDSVGICAATCTGDNKQCTSIKNRDRRKQLHLRKNAVQPLAMQSEDKRGPTKIAEEWEQSTVWPSSKKPSQEPPQSQHGTNDSGNALRFTCSQCSDNLEYVPKDLMRHFEEKHGGIAPVFSCHECNFSTHEFSYLQVHLLSHKDTFSSCSMCNDNVKRTWPELCAHLTAYHCPDGKYSCEMCQKFSTGDVRVFLEHMYIHNLDPEGADNLSLHTKDTNQLLTTQSLHCHHSGFEASQKWLIAKRIKTAHVCQNGNQKKKRKDVDTIPNMKPRTRSAVREMCWLTQDCLSLPGKEFLDKYCHLSDPQTTLEETQQFLMKSVAGETGDQKWTKALKTVLSSIPQDMNLLPKPEDSIVSSDLTVLTLKNKITVAQNGAAYGKRLKMVAASDKEDVCSESAGVDAQSVVDQNGCQSMSNECAPCPQAENNLRNDISASAQSELSERAHMQENRENQELKAVQEPEEHMKKLQGPVYGDGIHASSDLKLTKEIEEQTPVYKAMPKNKRKCRRRKRKTRFKKADERSPELSLKIVLKKNPVKDKQWVSQTSLSPSDGSVIHDHHGLQYPAMEETVQILQNVCPVEAHQMKLTKGSEADLHDQFEATDSILQSKPREDFTPGCTAKPTRSKNMTANMPDVHEGLLPGHQELQDGTEKSQHFMEVDKSSSACQMSPSVTEVKIHPENVRRETSQSGSLCPVSGDEMSSVGDGVTPQSGSQSSSISQPVIPTQNEREEVSSCGPSAEQSDRNVEGMKFGEVPVDFCPDILGSSHLPAGKAIEEEPSSPSGCRWRPVPKNLERTLKLIALNPSQLVKRPAGEQPVVVLNHPDADIPEVARIMEVVNRYRGDVRKVILSRRTLNALSALSGELPRTNDPTDGRAEPARNSKNSVQERFSLKFRLRRLSRKKYEMVGAVSPSRDVVTKFRCWFCGRVFTSQEMWMAHRQRHLIEWNRPNCENS